MTLPVAPWVHRPYNPDPGDILAGLATTNGATVITIPAGRTWYGMVTLTGGVSIAAAVTGANASVRASTAGAGVIPPAGDYIRLDLSVAGGVLGAVIGTDGNGTLAAPLYVAAPTANPVTLVMNSTGTTVQSVSANGLLL